MTVDGDRVVPLVAVDVSFAASAVGAERLQALPFVGSPLIYLMHRKKNFSRKDTVQYTPQPLIPTKS